MNFKIYPPCLVCLKREEDKDTCVLVNLIDKYRWDEVTPENREAFQRIGLDLDPDELRTVEMDFCACFDTT